MNNVEIILTPKEFNELLECKAELIAIKAVATHSTYACDSLEMIKDILGIEVFKGNE